MFEETQKIQQRTYQKNLIKFLNKHQFSLVISYREKTNWFKDLKKLAFKYRLPILFLRISSKNVNHAFNMYQMKYYPNLRFYMGHPELYVQFIGKFTKKNTNKKELNQDVENFIIERKKNSYTKINNKKNNIKEYINFLLNQNESFLYYKGTDNKNQCFKLFVLFSKSSDKYIISHWQDDVFQTQLYPQISKDQNNDIKDGFYLYRNYEKDNKLLNLCDITQEIKLNKKLLLGINKQIRDNYYQTLQQLQLDELFDDDNKFYFIMNMNFFKQQININNITKTYLKNLEIQLSKRLKQFQFYAPKKETQKTLCRYIDSQENLEEYNYIMNMVGYQNRKNFLYILKRHSYKPEILQKYQLDLTQPMKIRLNIQKIITNIKRKKLKPFLKSGIDEQKDKQYLGLKEIPLNDLKIIVKNNMPERILFYCFKQPNNDTLKKLVEFQKDKLMVFLIDMEENEVVEMLEGIKNKNEYYLLKEPMNTELISASWETVETPYIWQGPGDEL